MSQHVIRRRHTDSVNAVDQQDFLDVQLQSTQRLLHHTDVRGEIDRYEQFLKERRACDTYRVILTINPYCTNVLFNTLTEINYKEGTDEAHAVKDSGTESISGVMGTSSPNRVQMINNTEYSKPEYGYTYHPGYDIFDNHILRSKVFRLVNKPVSSGKKEFNTIEDILRWSNGEEIYINPHVLDASGENIILVDSSLYKGFPQHLYTYDDILEMGNGDSINANLSEENGWYGFVNNSTIESEKYESGNWNDLGISHVLNDNKNCEFVDMYPDRTLFSFNPKFNEYRKRLEYNWDIVLTYPYEMVHKGYSLIDFTSSVNGVEYQNTTGLRVMSVEKLTGNSGGDVLLFRTFVKHGLKRGDTIALYQNTTTGGGDVYETYEKKFKVSNVGDMSGNNGEYFFQLTDMDVYKELDETLTDEETTDEDVNVFLNSSKFYFRRSVNGVECEYYFRKFRKMPNRRWANKAYDGDDKFDDFVDANCRKVIGEMYDFDREHYQLAFASTIYNDNSTQVTFTDNVDVSNLVDHRGRPVTELYATLIKTNRGHVEWYSGNFTTDKVEYSHCFGPVSSGIEFKGMRGDDLTERKSFGDARLLCINSAGGNVPSYVGEDDIVSSSDGFFGDLAEFSFSDAEERILDDFKHRFNTVQRELSVSDTTIFNHVFTTHDIVADDYDMKTGSGTASAFKVEETPLNQYDENSGVDVLNRPEGYLYTPHYRMQIRQFGEIQQAGHQNIRVLKAEPAQIDGIYIKITSATAHHLVKGDEILLCDDVNRDSDNNRLRFPFVVTYIDGKNTFYIGPKVKKGSTAINRWKDFSDEMQSVYGTPINWINLCLAIMNGAEDGTMLVTKDGVFETIATSKWETYKENGWTTGISFKVRAKNMSIPKYADEIQPNVFLWRPVLRVGDQGADEIPDYPFTNGALYIHKDINFFLRRQDPEGINGLYCKDAFPNDIPGDIRKESNYEYKDESSIVC